MDKGETVVTVLKSGLLAREGFEHGFGTKRKVPGDYPERVHILLQVHGERVVVLTNYPVPGTRYPEKGLKPTADSRQPETSGIWNLEFGIAGSGLEVEFIELPAAPFRFDEGDAMVSDIPGISMGIRTADCLPLLICDRISGTAAAVHCGWRSLALGFAGKVVRVMTGIMGSEPGRLLAAIGPSIGPCCYEVGQDVREAFSHFESDKGLFEQLAEGKWCLDLASGVKTQLIMEGMTPETVDEIVGCTSCNPDLFWSHRARKDRERMISYITARDPL